MAPQVAVSLTTLAGTSLELALAPETSVRQAKEAAGEELGRPAELQRWLVAGTAVEDGELLRDVLQSDAVVLCVFLPRTFEVQVTVITWAHGAQAEHARDVRVAVSPSLNIEAVKYEIAEKCGLPPGSSMRAARLVKGGLHMDDEKTVEQYHLDPNAKLHFVVPRCWKDEMPEGCAVRAPEASRSKPEADQIVNAMSFDEFYGFSKKGNWNCTDKEVSPDKTDVKDGQQSPTDKDPQELLRTMGRYPLRPRRRAASTPPERASSSDQEASPSLTLTSPGATPILSCCDSEGRGCRIEQEKPSNASNASASPCGPSRRPPRPPTRPTTQNGEQLRPATQRGGMERPGTQRCDTQIRAERPSIDVFNASSSVEWRPVSSPRQPRHNIMHGGARGRSSPRARSVGAPSQIDRWAQIQRC